MYDDNFDDFLATGYDATMPDASMADAVPDDIIEGDLADEGKLLDDQFLNEGVPSDAGSGNVSIIGGFDGGL